jgi:hypothetical protein
MAERIGEDGVRVRFHFEKLGELPRPGPRELTALVGQLAESGLCPILEDGLLAGNASARAGPTRGDGIWVSPSGRKPGQALRPEDLVLVTDFDPERWVAHGYAPGTSSPTSDTPLHWACLVSAWPQLHGMGRPQVALHGHALADSASAAALGVPISAEETLFSTPDDRAALLHLLETYPYPAQRVWSRRGHGFFQLAADYASAARGLARLDERELP